MVRRICFRFHLKQAFKYILVFAILWLAASSLWSYLKGSGKHSGTSKATAHQSLKLPSGQTQDLLDYLSYNLRVNYVVLRNEEKAFFSEIRLKNVGNRSISSCCWTIFFYHFNIVYNAVNIRKDTTNGGLKFFHDDTLENLQSSTDVYRISHVNSNTYRVDVTDSFQGVRPGEEAVISLTGFRWIVSRSQVLPNWYVASDDPSTEPRLLRSTAGEDLKFVKPFETLAKTSRSKSDLLKPFTPEVRFDKNKIADFGSAPREILPTPNAENGQLLPKELLVESISWRIYYSKELKNEADYLQDHLNIDSLEELRPDTGTPPKSFILRLDDDASTGNNSSVSEGYRVKIDPDKESVLIVATSSAGAFYGVVSVVSLAKPTPSSSSEFYLTGVELVDKPRFAYRGLMVDVVRNFHSKDQLLKLVDAMAMYKMNKLHLHLSDDEGWRLEIPGLEELTQFGSMRCHDLSERRCLMPLLGSGPFANSSGSGFYSIKDYREILRRAQLRHIEIIPEFDMPGHSHAAVRAMEFRRARLLADGHAEQADDYVLSDPDDKSSFLSAQHFTGGVINPCLESSYRFVNHVIEAVIKMHKSFTPLKKFHFGGDEVPNGAYLKSPVCMKYLQSHPELSDSKSLKGHFIRKVSDIIAHHGLEVVGWEDAFSNSSGHAIPLSELKSKTVISQAWYNIWESGYVRRAYQYANGGYKVILTPVTAVYLDHPQEPDPEDWGLYWATRYTDARRTFFFAPESLYDNIDFDFWGARISKQNMCGQKIQCPDLKSPENIIGFEAALWSEVVRTPERMDAMLWPRLLAVAERSWHKADWESMKIDCDDLASCPGLQKQREARKLSWTRFANTVGYRELKRLEKLGINYYLPRPGARVVEGKLMVNSLFPGLVIQTSTDNGKTWKDFNSKTSFSGQVLLATRSFDGKRRSIPVEITVA